MSQNISTGIKKLISDANNVVPTKSIDEAKKLYKDENYVFIDLRDIRELREKVKYQDLFLAQGEC